MFKVGDYVQFSVQAFREHRNGYGHELYRKWFEKNNHRVFKIKSITKNGNVVVEDASWLIPMDNFEEPNHFYNDDEEDF